jgi:flavorubredoxin
MTPRIDEIAPDVYRISVYVRQFDLQFNHFLVRDDEPLLFHTGMRGMFPAVREAVAALIPPEGLRWISWSHFEVDECGALNEWLAIAPKALPVCGELGAMINIGDFSNRPPRPRAKAMRIVDQRDVRVNSRKSQRQSARKES